MTEAIEGKLYSLKHNQMARGFEHGKLYMISEVYQKSKNAIVVDWLVGMQIMQKTYFMSEFDDKFRLYVGQEIDQ